MAPDWPNTITSRHHHLRRRAEAYASALYYSECSLSGISPDGAAAAEENARSGHSRWWLKGNDPNHPSLQSPESAKLKAITSCDAKVEEEKPKPNQASELAEETNDEAHTDEGNDSAVANIREEHDELTEDDSNAPLLARDDDWGSSFGTLSNFCTSRNASPYGVENNADAIRNPHVVSSHSSLSPSWLMSRPQSSSDATSQVFKQDIGSSVEMLKSYSTYPPNQLLTKEKNHEPISIGKPQLGIAHQITSESEAGDSISSGGLSCDGSLSCKPKFQGVASNVTRSRKRDRVGVAYPLDQTYLDARIATAKTELLSTLENEGKGPAFQNALATLEKYAKLKASSNNKKRKLSAHGADIDGTWLTVSPPEYLSCLGKNSEGESLFTLGRMSFDMYQPSNLVCSIQNQYNTIKSVEPKDLPLYVPKTLRREVDKERSGECRGRLKTFNIIASFTIEDTAEITSSEDAIQVQSKKPLRGILTNYGYVLPDPTLSDRKSIWFTGGTIEPAGDDSLDEWKKIFGSNSEDSVTKESKSPEIDTSKSQSTIEAEKARTLASKILLGAVHEPMNNQGTVGFHLNKPIGGHGSAYCDIVYMDDELRVTRGHSGSIYVFKRV
eukprot:CAMPEP_0202024768 /NCGR_PEP_ID=MMETSP0905-20130828/54838_1 /ASSEMBLY_ACC=CAM_ASM_000554 /TAXON_ID=420261 /ORGANISM="Thalassiosira antarctica, Strain CCMP982" /LENGTH=611 /DNA_ID=CAMNT_0048587491 /DNA_START=40 /DNA_END=1875 /DNA_ORIENTATION=-